MCRVFVYYWAECQHFTMERLICGRAPCTDISPADRTSMRGKCLNCLRQQYNIQEGFSDLATVTQHVPSRQTTFLDEVLVVEDYASWDEQRRRETILEENRLAAIAHSDRALSQEEAHRLAELLDNAYNQIMRHNTEPQFFGPRRPTVEQREIQRIHRLSEAVLAARVQTDQEARIARDTREVTLTGVRAMVSLLERAPEQPEDDRCPICYDIYTEEHFPVHIPCPARHVLGAQCIITWFQEIVERNRTRYNPNNGTCPCCRALVIDLSSPYGWFTGINAAQPQNDNNDNNLNNQNNGGPFLDIGINRGRDPDEDDDSD